MDWHELYVLTHGWFTDNRFHLHRSVSPDWEWSSVTNILSSYSLYALQGANWQRAGGRGKKPKLVTASLLRGESSVDDSVVSKTGVKSGRRRGGERMAVSSSADFASVRDRMEALRAARRSVSG